MTEEQKEQSLETAEEQQKAEEQNVSQAPVDEEPIDVDEDNFEQKVAELEQAAEASEEKYLRLYAEFENYKKRTRAELDTERTYRSQSVLRDIIPALDNIERALSQKGEDPAFQSLYKGLQMIHENLVSALKDHGLEEIEAENQPFDPNLHQAVMQDKDDSKDSGVVLEELQKGYKLKERVLRPSMVKVNE
ncbi:nucleotide exchange factor GrpE [Macrococcus equipercicus]|uniref:Protein GrpE n=1 Tax=Macrococcus equipercicus TaxID=69967 RepID=A0A9Q9F2M5_9STAP|nr:nucleotide exchange factor GrpE [Macrococcus equipercicus]KAA1040062.1 nucleotide exchange factor GrpE [Macrococcus equipercicus]UTH12989.1 nucleotide exchange factor GrpE [Macrococcus equipercicus]